MVGKAFFENLGESLNPVFVKEMRQYFQNRRMVIFMGLLLIVQFIVALFFASAMTLDADGDEVKGNRLCKETCTVNPTDSLTL